MSKLYDLLYTMIGKLNSSVKTTPQTLTDAEKTQARANIGAQPVGDYATKKDIPTIPSKLPNPHALTINGETYDGSSAVSITVEGGGGMGGADWNASEGEPGHILNKPFGEKEVVILPETELTFEAMEDFGGMAAAFTPLSILPIDGHTYKVNWNGKEYKTEYIHYGDEGLMGNVGALEGGEGSGEPFVVMVSVFDKIGIFVPLDGSTEATASIAGIHPVSISPEYAPPYAEIDLVAAGLPTVVDTNTVSLSGIDMNLYRTIATTAKLSVCKIKVSVQCEKYINPIYENDPFSCGFNNAVFIVNVYDDGTGNYTLQGIKDNILLTVQVDSSLQILARVRNIAFL